MLLQTLSKKIFTHKYLKNKKVPKLKNIYLKNHNIVFFVVKSNIFRKKKKKKNTHTFHTKLI